LIEAIVKKNLQPKYTKNLRKTLVANYNITFCKCVVENTLFSKIYTSKKYYERLLIVKKGEIQELKKTQK